jgi:hypothetical protein
VTEDVIQFHREAYQDTMTFLSDDIILIDGNLGVLNKHTLSLLKELDAHLKDFRRLYQPFNYSYTFTASPTTIVCHTHPSPNTSPISQSDVQPLNDTFQRFTSINKHDPGMIEFTLA